MYFLGVHKHAFSGGVKRSLLETESVGPTSSLTPSKNDVSALPWWSGGGLLASRAQGPGLIPDQELDPTCGN